MAALAGVDALVPSEVLQRRVRLVAEPACETRPRPVVRCVRPHVDLEVRRLDERLLTELAAEGSLPGMYSHVSPQITAVNKALVTHGADKRSVSRVYSYVALQIGRLLEPPIAHVAGKCPISGIGETLGTKTTRI